MTAAERLIEFGHKEGLRLGLEQGLEQARERVRKQVQVSMLTRLVQKKFGTISAQYQRLLTEADEADLLTLSERIFEANSLEELFNQ